ncbi:MAG: 5'-methylthioadenosine/S-adenosylhomocysteine nucleosidase [Spirochaetales bacterium]|nr:5'-methylthioadenosine/S-adenosylhomocysteine nucleosidase [Spirochaetales bacterium]
MNVVLISAETEWKIVKEYFNYSNLLESPFGEYFFIDDFVKADEKTVLFHGGWGKVNSAGSTQYAIDKFNPDIIINIGSCGGFDELVSRGDIVLAEKTVIYDIYEKMFDPVEAVNEFTSIIDLNWLKEPFPIEVTRSLLISGDSDLDPKSIADFKIRYSAIAGDWESGAIAHICKLNNVRCLILKGVSDIVSEETGEAYRNPQLFVNQVNDIMKILIDSLPAWFNMFYKN